MQELMITTRKGMHLHQFTSATSSLPWTVFKPEKAEELIDKLYVPSLRQKKPRISRKVARR